MRVKLIVEDTYEGLENAINNFIEWGEKEIINISMSESRSTVSALILYKEVTNDWWRKTSNKIFL
mgnify:CR=1 FL=1